MNNILEILKELVIVYGSTTVSSVLFNLAYFNKEIQKSCDNSKRKLKFRDLSVRNEEELTKIEDFCKVEKTLSMICSIIPLYQVIYTVNNITRDKKAYSEFFEDKIEEINKRELSDRKRYLEEIKKLRIVPESLKEKLKDEDYMPSENEYLEARLVNMIKSNKKIKKLIK